MRHLTAIFITSFLVGVGLLVVNGLTQSKLFVGQEVQLEIHNWQELTIRGEGITVSAKSEAPFRIDGESKTIPAAEVIQNWYDETSTWLIESVPISAGDWVVPHTEDVKVLLKSSSNIAVLQHLPDQNKNIIRVGVLFICAIMWVLLVGISYGTKR